ncbi:hypothetical protein FQZ97_1214750 [compost metagenome]
MQARGHVARTERQLPDEQADPVRIAAYILSRHRSGDFSPRALASLPDLHMLRQTPVQLALQYQLSILARQPCGNSRHFTRIGGPVLAA